MSEKVFLTHADVANAAEHVANLILQKHPSGPVKLYGVPRGGIPAAYILQGKLRGMGMSAHVVEHPLHASVIVDDILDSGHTRDRFEAQYPVPFVTLFQAEPARWLVFPWEQTLEQTDESATDIVTRLLQFIGEDPSREGLRDTPQRVLKAWKHYFSGYDVDPASVMKVFTDGAQEYTGNEMVLVARIPVYSHCEHHMAPIFGWAHVAYIPNGKILGLSKFARLVDVFARRLQVQERLTNQIADALDEHLRPLGVGVLLNCRHMCMEARGVEVATSRTTTSALRGQLLLNPAARAEFMQLVTASEAR